MADTCPYDQAIGINRKEGTSPGYMVRIEGRSQAESTLILHTYIQREREREGNYSTSLGSSIPSQGEFLATVIKSEISGV